MTWGETVRLLRVTLSRWNDHNAARMGAALACYTLLSLAPLVIFLVTLVSVVFGESRAQGWLLQEVSQSISPQAAQICKALIENAHRDSSGWIAGVIGLGTLLFGASSVFGELRDALNVIWDASASTVTGLKAVARKKILAFMMVLAAGFVILLSVLVNTVFETAVKYFQRAAPVPVRLFQLASAVVSVLFLSFVFALIFKYVPDRRVAWKDVLLGAGFTGLLFSIGKELLARYLVLSSVSSAYGVAGSVVALVVWVYYSSQIFLFGAEFTWVHAQRAKEIAQLKGSTDANVISE